MPTSLRLVKRNGMSKATGGATIAGKKAFFQKTARNLQKTSVGLDNFHVKN